MKNESGGLQFREEPVIRGRLRYTIFQNGVPIERVAENNLIVNGARAQMAHLLAGDVEDRSIDRIAVGTSGSVPIVGDTAITEPFIKPVTGFEYPEHGQVQINWKLETSEANGIAIREFGLLTGDDTLFARRTRSQPIHKDSDISIEGEWIITF